MNRSIKRALVLVGGLGMAMAGLTSISEAALPSCPAETCANMTADCRSFGGRATVGTGTTKCVRPNGTQAIVSTFSCTAPGISFPPYCLR